MSISDYELLLHLADALDPHRAVLVSRALELDPALRDRLERLERSGAPPDPPSAWIFPPPGILPEHGTLSVWSQPEATLNRMARATGRLFEVSFGPIAEANARRLFVLLLVHEDEAWKVILPVEGDIVLVSDLSVDRRGVRSLPLRSRTAAATERWALALVPRELAPDWGRAIEERWIEVQNRLARLEISARVFSLAVEPSL